MIKPWLEKKKKDEENEEEIKMNEKKSNQFIGIIFLALGIVLALKSIIGFGSLILFDGWWTLFIIVPAVYSIVKNGLNKKNGIAGIAGVLLLINCRTGFLGAIFSKLFVPIILLAIGYRMLTKNHNEGGKNNIQNY